MDAWQICLARDAEPREAGDRRVALDIGAEADRVDEPAAPLGAAAGDRRLDPLDAGEALGVGAGQGRAPLEHAVELLDLRHSQRRGEIAEPVVEAEPAVVEPAHVDGPALIALGT